MTAKIENAIEPSAEAVRAARNYINNHIKIQSLNEDQQLLKPVLVDEANGQTLTIPVPGKGKVQVTAPSEVEPVPGEFTYSFDAAKFADLPQVLKRKMLQAGVVTQSPKTRGGANATVRVTLNV
jgi:hypothetical protein